MKPPVVSTALIGGLRTIIAWLEENAARMPSMPDTTDADMALMYLRHVEKHLSYEIKETQTP